ncbi:ABC-type phosphate transport system permease component [Halosimplex carlsbadense 2-9-1]|uniref:ABC-type phosphate transport system permease component n=1 Tax=Halosimplex carlsbadense 2-9-1 TaxID=797114 RepID=M0CG94_9EURY|nr:hypothetical protein [Halosimplex carlsbadense]ELZ22295.1 ABC-type phosphate transport system permease component [Halosimplex carlsbadense 2-9-1]
MSRPTADAGERAAGAASRDRPASGLPVSLATLLGSAALVPTAGVLALRLARNAPVGLPPAGRAATPAVTTLAAVVPALALLGLAVDADARAERVALAAAGVFGLVGAADAAAWLPAAAAVLAGTSAALVVELAERAHVRVGPVDSLRAAFAPIARPAAVAALGALALAWSLAASAGIGTTTLRPAGAAVAFATLAALPLARGVDRTLDLGLWAVAAFAVVVAAASAPFVAGAVALVAFGAGTVPLALLALGIGGALTTVVADARRRAFGPAVAAALLLFAGVPGTLPRAVAFALGLVVLVREWAPAGAETERTPGGVADA